MKVWSRVVMAAVVVGFGLSAATVYAVTAPGPPRNLKASAGDQQVTLTWSAPSVGTPPISYTITYTPGFGRVSDATSPYTATGLTNGTTYAFAVRSSNAAGPGGPNPAAPAGP